MADCIWRFRLFQFIARNFHLFAAGVSPGDTGASAAGAALVSSLGVVAAFAAGARAAVALDRLGNADTKKLFAVPTANRLRATPCVELEVQQLVVNKLDGEIASQIDSQI